MRSLLIVLAVLAASAAHAQAPPLFEQAERAAWAVADDALRAAADALDAPDRTAAVRAVEHAASARTLFDVVAALRAERGDAVPRCRAEARAVGVMDEVTLAAVSVLFGSAPPEASRLTSGRALVAERLATPEGVCDAALGPPAPPGASDAHAGHDHAGHDHHGHGHPDG